MIIEPSDILHCVLSHLIAKAGGKVVISQQEIDAIPNRTLEVSRNPDGALVLTVADKPKRHYTMNIDTGYVGLRR